MIKLFEKLETDKYTIIKILFVKITFKKKSPIDIIVWWLPFRSLRNAVKNIYHDLNSKIDNLSYIGYQTQREIYISRNLYSNNIQNFKKQPLASVLISVYNIGEKYLRHCLETVINQSYKNIEIIIVNDCSDFEEDEQICLEYASKDNRIKYIKHKENMGYGIARMTGLKEAKGYSVLFMDGDDYIALNLLEVAMFEMIKNDVDIVCYNFFTVREENNKIEFNHSYFRDIPYQILYGEDVIDLFCNLNVYISGHLWNKLFKRELLLELGFDNIFARYKCEDLNYCFKIFLKSKSIVYIPLNLYFYIENRNNSAVNINRFKDGYIADMYYIYSDMFDYLNKESNDKITKLLASNFLWLFYESVAFDNAKIREENHFINIFKKVILDLTKYGAIDKEKLLNNVKNMTNDKNLINWLANLVFDNNINNITNKKI